jgi:hypothetical protein
MQQERNQIDTDRSGESIRPTQAARRRDLRVTLLSYRAQRWNIAACSWQGYDVSLMNWDVSSNKRWGRNCKHKYAKFKRYNLQLIQILV